MYRRRLLGGADAFLWALAEVTGALDCLRWGACRTAASLAFLSILFSLSDAVLRKNDINGQAHHVFNHSWKEAFEELTGLFEAGVRVDLDEPAIEVLVKDEVISEELEAELSIIWINCSSNCIECL